MMKRYLLLFVCSLLLQGTLAELKLPYFFSDGMVLQQNSLVPLWGKATPGVKVQVSTSWNRTKQQVIADAQGNWKVHLKTPSAGGPYRIRLQENKNVRILKDVLMGEVWILGGQSNMEMPLKGFQDQPVEGSSDEILNSASYNVRWFKVSRASKTFPLDTVKPFAWHQAGPDNVADLSATGWFFAKTLSQHLGVPIGVISCNYGGSSAEAWMRPEALAAFGDYHFLKPDERIVQPTRTPSLLYNGMLHPLQGYGIRGVVWYQGESNYPHPERYEQLFPLLVRDWRTLWQQGDFPFYYVQIAPFDYPSLHDSDYVNSAYLRDAQRKVEPLIPNSGMVVLMDGGDSTGIHPRNKALPGLRLASLALAKTYGLQGLACTSPRFQKMEIKDSLVTLSFENTSTGLSTFGRELASFELAGADKRFYPAKARISSGKILVSSPLVPLPVAVRYAFKDFVTASLFGCNGLPVSSFRTDSW